MADHVAESQSAPGVCPFCSSTEVVRLSVGMPAGPDVGADDPPWVRHVGCVHPGHTHECGTCGSTWTPAPVFVDLGHLMAAAGSSELEGLCDWLSQDYELDAWVITDEDGYFEVGFADRGVGIEFPIPERAFWAALDELHREVEDGLESVE